MFRVRFTKSGRSSRGSSSSMKRLSPRSFDVSGAPINRRVAFSKQLPILTSAGISGYVWLRGDPMIEEAKVQRTCSGSRISRM